MRCSDCKVTFEQPSYQYCPLCGKALGGCIIKFPTQPLPTNPFDVPWPNYPAPYVGDPMPYTKPYTVWC